MGEYKMIKFLRKELLPHTMCPGCGGGTVLNVFTRAVEELNIDPREIITVSGIGCSAWIPSPYFKSDTLHVTHGRPIAFAMGVKIGLPDKYVVVISGDGDLAGIGGNHLLHAARRNIDLKVILVNNYIYGMTGGQVSPTTPFGAKSTTTPYGNVEYPMKIAEVMVAAGATYVARWTTFHVFQLLRSIKKAMFRKGFSFLEVFSQCPVQYGRRNNFKTATAMLKFFQKNSIPYSKAKNMKEEELEDKIVVGEFVEKEKKEFVTELYRISKEIKP